MRPEALLDGLRAGNDHSGGIRCLRLFTLQESAFHALRVEVAQLCARERPSDVQSADHITNWVRPRGEVLQYSLFNRSGRADDFSDDHDLSRAGKRCHQAAACPLVAQLVESLPDLINVRVNVLGPRARLSAHEEHSVIRTPTGSIGACVRVHLPLVTSTDSELVLDGDVYHLATGGVYLVNHGCVHAARNRGHETRIHLVWDQLLTTAAFDSLFRLDLCAGWATPVADAERRLSPLRTERMGACLRLPPPVARDEASRVALAES